MVEKLLETATLDSENLELNKEPLDILEVINTLIKNIKCNYRKTINLCYR